MTNNAQIATRALSEFNLSFGVREVRGNTVVEMSFGDDMLPVTLNCVVVFDKDDDAISVRCLDYVSYPPEARESIRELCSECNRKYRFAKFVTDPDTETVDVHIETFVNPSNVLVVMHSCLRILLELLRQTYPMFVLRQKPGLQILPDV